VLELKSIRSAHPELADAVDLHLELFELHRRILPRVPLPTFDLSPDTVTRHAGTGRPLLSFEAIPLELSDLRLMVRQTADVLRRAGALEDADYQQVQALGRDQGLVPAVADWYRATAGRDATSGPRRTEGDSAMLDQVLTLVMRPFLARCAEVLQQHSGLGAWQHPFCALCGGEPDIAVITPSAERHLVCGRCSLQWRFAPLACPFCPNTDRSRITSFATTDGQYRVYACDVCHRYLKAYDGRRGGRGVMPIVDGVATLPLDAAAMQRGYVG
jgi:hypothetical protein